MSCAARVFELGQKMVTDWYASKDKRDPARRTLTDDVMEAHERDPELMPANNLILMVTSPFVAGLDTVANTTAAIVYTVLKHPEVRERVLREVDALFANGTIEEAKIATSVPTVTAAPRAAGSAMVAIANPRAWPVKACM